MRINVLVTTILGVLFLVAGIAVTVTHLDDTPSGGHWVHKAGGGLAYRSSGGGLLIMGITFVVVGVVLIPVGLLMARSAAASAQLLATGLAGQATITGLTQTGMIMNQSPQVSMDLMVEVPGQTAYPVKHTEFVPLMCVGRLSTGAPLQVRVDAANPQRIAIDWSKSMFTAKA